jgi:hypothetical protein
MASPSLYAFSILSQVSSSSMSSLPFRQSTSHMQLHKRWMLPLKKYLLRHPSGESVQVCARVAAREVITAPDLQIRLFDQGRPDEARIAAVNNIECAVG